MFRVLTFIAWICLFLLAYFEMTHHDFGKKKYIKLINKHCPTDLIDIKSEIFYSPEVQAK